MPKQKPKKPTLNEVRQVISNLIHDLNLINQKIDSIAFIVSEYIEYKGDLDNFQKHAEKVREQNERNKPIETSDKTDSESDSKTKSVGSVSKS